MKKSIVCGVDGSPNSQAALTVAARLADDLDAQLVLAYVVEHVHSHYATAGAAWAATIAQPPLAEALDTQVRAGEQVLEEMAERAGVESAERRVVSGLAAERLAELADEEGAELIVVGSRGRGAFKAAFLGSVSTSVIGVARCPVLVVPAGVRSRTHAS